MDASPTLSYPSVCAHTPLLSLAGFRSVEPGWWWLIRDPTQQVAPAQRLARVAWPFAHAEVPLALQRQELRHNLELRVRRASPPPTHTVCAGKAVAC